MVDLIKNKCGLHGMGGYRSHGGVLKLQSNYQMFTVGDGLNPPEPAVTTLGVMHKANYYRADSICPYSKMIANFCFDTVPYGERND